MLKMDYRPLAMTGLNIPPIVFGSNVFGWTIDEKESFSVLDALVERGFTAIDTADVYSRWVPGNKGGESETIIGNWLRARPGLRQKVTIFTKCGSDRIQEGEKGLSEDWIRQSVDRSLARLGIDRVELFFSHRFDPRVPQEETLGTYARLIEAGKIGAIGASNFDHDQLSRSLAISEREGLPAYQVIQPEYNLYDRARFDGPLRDLCLARGIGVVSYYSLASGFLSGKYRSDKDLDTSRRGRDRLARYMTPRGVAILDALDRVATRHGVGPAEVALAWLLARPGITAPIASVTSIAQLDSFERAVALKLGGDEVDLLDRASA